MITFRTYAQPGKTPPTETLTFGSECWREFVWACMRADNATGELFAMLAYNDGLDTTDAFRLYQCIEPMRLTTTGMHEKMRSEFENILRAGFRKDVGGIKIV